MVLTGGRVGNTATNLVTTHNLETGEEAVQKLEKKKQNRTKIIFMWELQQIGFVFMSRVVTKESCV